MTHMYHGRAALKAMKCWSTACGGIQNKQVYTKKNKMKTLKILCMMINSST